MTIAEYAETLSDELGIDIGHQQVPWETFETAASEEITAMYRAGLTIPVIPSRGATGGGAPILFVLSPRPWYTEMFPDQHHP